MNVAGNIRRVVFGEPIGTVVGSFAAEVQLENAAP
jgi:hypothetical protein